jgi:excisionase family DNA binding protein
VQVGQVGILSIMKVLRLSPAERSALPSVAAEIQRLLDDGKSVSVTVAVDDEVLSPQQAAERLGFSRQHVVRLIGGGVLEAEKMPGSSYWQIPLASVIVFEEQREQARRQADEFSRALDELGAPLE